MDNSFFHADKNKGKALSLPLDVIETRTTGKTLAAVLKIAK